MPFLLTNDMGQQEVSQRRPIRGLHLIFIQSPRGDLGCPFKMQKKLKLSLK